MLLVTGAHAFEDPDRLVHGRFFHHDGLEAALQGGVLLDVLAIFLQRGGADDLQFAACQGRLEDIGGVHGRACRTGTHQHVHFVNEYDGAGCLQLIDDALEAFFELPAVHRPGHQRTHIQLQHAFAKQGGGNVAVDDALGEPLHDGGLAHTGFTDEGGIVLVAARQDLDDALDLHLAPDDRVQAVLLGQRGQLNCQLIDERGLLLFSFLFFLVRVDSRSSRAGGRGSLKTTAGFQDARHLAADLFVRDAQLAKHFQTAVLAGAQQSQQEMLRADVVGLHAPGFVHRELQNLLDAGGKVNALLHGRAEAAQFLDDLAHALCLHAQVAQHARSHAAFLVDQPQQQVLGADRRLAVALGFQVRQVQYSARALSESFQTRHTFSLRCILPSKM